MFSSPVKKQVALVKFYYYYNYYYYFALNSLDFVLIPGAKSNGYLDRVYWFHKGKFTRLRSSPPEEFLGKDVLKICSKFTGEHLWRATTGNPRYTTNLREEHLLFICLPAKCTIIFRTTFSKIISLQLLLSYDWLIYFQKLQRCCFFIDLSS